LPFAFLGSGLVVFKVFVVQSFFLDAVAVLLQLSIVVETFETPGRIHVSAKCFQFPSILGELE